MFASKLQTLFVQQILSFMCLFFKDEYKKIITLFQTSFRYTYIKDDMINSTQIKYEWFVRIESVSRNDHLKR